MMVQGGDMQGSMWGAQSAHYLVNEVHECSPYFILTKRCRKRHD